MNGFSFQNEILFFLFKDDQSGTEEEESSEEVGNMFSKIPF